MATWPEVQRALREGFVLDDDRDHELALTLPVPGTDRAQRVMVRHYEALNDEFVELRSAFAEAATVDPAEALDDNLSLVVGAIARHGRYLVVVHRIALRPTAVQGVISAMSHVAGVADWLESRHGGDRF